ncbi:hypothetical protein ERO13_A12G000500v2 [Gossypium hirsutum]|nr:hypothetical protein ERO13_A12G000500v2 [Gossypium hirsutum]
MNPYVGHQNPLKEGQELLRKGLLSEAVLDLEAEVIKNPENAEGWRLLGITHAENDYDQQAVRNEKDMDSLNVPPKFWEMKSFWKYYSGHEASNYLWELYYGGWAAPNIYFLGFAGVVKFGNIRIGGLFGIYNARNYCLGHHERPPYNDNTIRSVYHVREYDAIIIDLVEIHICERMKIFISSVFSFLVDHFWLLVGTLGSKPAAQLFEKLKPSYWFSAHLHCKFTALVEHEEGGRVTKFLALDKCLPGCKFLQVLSFGPYEVQYNEEWLAITRKLNCFGRTQLDMQDCRQWVKSRMEDRGAKPCEFSQTAPPHKPSDSVSNTTFSDLPYVLDNASDSRDTPASLPQKDNSINFSL